MIHFKDIKLDFLTENSGFLNNHLLFCLLLGNLVPSFGTLNPKTRTYKTT